MIKYRIKTTLRALRAVTKKSEYKRYLKKIFFPSIKEPKYYKWRVRQWLVYHQKRILFPDGKESRAKWQGIPIEKNPFDAWIYQEIIFEVKPDVIIEIGSRRGGSSLFFANLLDIVGKGNIISIEIDRSKYQGKHERIIELNGDSGCLEIIDQTRKLCENKTTLIIHDGDHSRDAVLKDLRAYSEFVTVNSYFIVEDGISDFFRAGEVMGSFGDGPLVATQLFLSENKHFVSDLTREKYLITYNPNGFLKRIN